MSEKEKMWLSIAMGIGGVIAFAYFGNKYGVGKFIDPMPPKTEAVEPAAQAV